MKTLLSCPPSVFAVEDEALKAVESQLGNEFVELVERSNAALDRGGKLVLTGIGKSGYIGKKIAATLSSIGSTAVFLHPVEASSIYRLPCPGRTASETQGFGR